MANTVDTDSGQQPLTVDSIPLEAVPISSPELAGLTLVEFTSQSAGGVAHDDPISSQVDVGPNGFVFTAAGSQRPTFKTDAIHPEAILYDGIDDSLANTAMALDASAGLTFFCVYEKVLTTGLRGFAFMDNDGDGGAAAFRSYQQSEEFHYFLVNDGAPPNGTLRHQSTEDVGSTGVHIMTARFGPGIVIGDDPIYFDGAPAVIQTLSGTMDAPRDVINEIAIGRAHPSVFLFGGYMYTWGFYYGGIMTPAQVAVLHASLNSRFPHS